MTRREFSGKIKVAAWKRSTGYCESCKIHKLSAGDVYYEHIIPDALGGPPTLANCGVYCKACWSAKTRTYDHPTIAKAKRIEMRHLGARKSRNPIKGWKKFDGTAVRNPRA